MSLFLLQYFWWISTLLGFISKIWNVNFYSRILCVDNYSTMDIDYTEHGIYRKVLSLLAFVFWFICKKKKNFNSFCSVALLPELPQILKTLPQNPLLSLMARREAAALTWGPSDNTFKKKKKAITRWHNSVAVGRRRLLSNICNFAFANKIIVLQ